MVAIRSTIFLKGGLIRFRELDLDAMWRQRYPLVPTFLRLLLRLIEIDLICNDDARDISCILLCQRLSDSWRARKKFEINS